MNILFSSDNNYARHLGVAMYSLMAHNQKAEKINFYVIENQITTDNQSKINQLVCGFRNSTISFIPFESFAKELKLDLPWTISLSAYARLFVATLLPTSIERILYLDCDMVVNGDLSELWNYDLNNNCIGAVQDQVFPYIKTSVGLSEDAPYFNSGLLLIDLVKWRSLQIGDKCSQFINRFKGKVIHHDQGVLNGIFQGHWIRLPLKYNVMTVHHFFSKKQIKKYYRDYSVFYDDAVIEDAISNPIIIHFTPSFTTRPWEKNCMHPLRNIYRYFLFETPWHQDVLAPDHNPWYIRLINWRYRNLPY